MAPLAATYCSLLPQRSPDCDPHSGTTYAVRWRTLPWVLQLADHLIALVTKQYACVVIGKLLKRGIVLLAQERWQSKIGTPT